MSRIILVSNASHDAPTEYLASWFSGIVDLVEGEKTGTAYIRSQNMYREKLTVLLTSDNTEYNTVLASRLYHNFQNQVCLGDQVASF